MVEREDGPSGNGAGETRRFRADEAPGQLERLVAVTGGLLLVVSYVLPWIEVTGETFPPGVDSLAGGDIATVPELAVVVGGFAVVLSLLRWNEWSQGVVGLVGFLAVSMALFVWNFVQSGGDLIEIGGVTAPPGAFDPSLGVWVVFGAGIALMAAGFWSLVSDRFAPEAD